MATEPDTPDVRSLVTIGLVSTFATIAISYLVVGMTNTERIKLKESRGEESKQAVIDKYAD